MMDPRHVGRPVHDLHADGARPDVELLDPDGEAEASPLPIMGIPVRCSYDEDNERIDRCSDRSHFGSRCGLPNELLGRRLRFSVA
jgi:hypothetical protein